jgi:hypothetical protein
MDSVSPHPKELQKKKNDWIYLHSFKKAGTGIKAMLRFCHSNCIGCNVCVTDGKGLSSELLIYIASFMMTGSGVEEILRFCISN